jgi:hypothetical protein
MTRSLLPASKMRERGSFSDLIDFMPGKMGKKRELFLENAF